MASSSLNPKKNNTTFPSQLDEDDVFQISPSQFHSRKKPSSTQHPSTLRPSNNLLRRPAKKPKLKPHKNQPQQHASTITSIGKENLPPNFTGSTPLEPLDTPEVGLDSIESTFDCNRHDSEDSNDNLGCGKSAEKVELGVRKIGGYLSNSIESRLMKIRGNDNDNCAFMGDLNSEAEEDGNDEDDDEEFELDVLLKLCADDNEANSSMNCPLCGKDISGLSGEMRQVHTNECLDKDDSCHRENNLPIDKELAVPNDEMVYQCPGQVVDGSPVRLPGKVIDVSPVLDWLHNLGLAKYEEFFVREEIDWDTLQWLTEEDLCSIGINALGPRKKIVHALHELRKKDNTVEKQPHVSRSVVDDTSSSGTNKLITDFFPGSVAKRNEDSIKKKTLREVPVGRTVSSSKSIHDKHGMKNGKFRETPLWCCIPGTPFHVDAFKYLRRDCSYWFLTHFHMDHYQGLTRSFCHGKIYCSSITAKLLNLKIGIPLDKIQSLPLNQKINIAGIDVTCFDANHCPGSIIILFEPPNGKAVLHTGDFRFCEEMTNIPILQTCRVHTLILDTTYCDPQYDFPKQEAVIQFVIEAIQAEAFNPKTLFLIGSYTIGKERLFLEVARALRKKVYVTAGKLRLLECLGLPGEDMQFLTLNEQESNIHIVPMWTLASFKRLKHISNQYVSRFSLIVAFSPTGWTFGKGKKKSPGRRWQQGTIIRYEVPYSEHSSFTELKEFVKFISPSIIIPSVNNNGAQSSAAMVSSLQADL